MCVMCYVGVSTCDRWTSMAPVSSQFLFASSWSLCVLTVGGRRSTPRSRPPRSPVTRRHCHVEAVSFLFILFFLWLLLFSRFFLGQNTHISAHQCVFYELWTTKRVVAAPVRKKFALSCRSERWLVLVRLNSWIRRLSLCWNKSV